MSTTPQWWAVWIAELSDEGSLHVRAASEAEAIARARENASFQWDDAGEPFDLCAAPVSDEVHAAWESDDA